MARAIRAVETAMPEASALGVLRAEALKVQDELDRLGAKLAELRAANQEITEQYPPAFRTTQEKDAVRLLGSGPPGLYKGLAYFGDFVFASYQAPRRTSAFVVSDAATSAFADFKRAGERDLASIIEPEFPVLPPGAPLLEPPVGLIGRGAVEYLLEQGYLTADRKKAADYICQRFDAAFRALGLNPVKCNYGRYASEYIVLGPLVLNRSQCLEIRALYLPTGIAEPKGEGCPRRTIRLNAELCIDEISQCARGGGIQIRH